MPVLHFEKSLIANVPLTSLWSEFEAAFQDSLACRFWPNHIEALRSEGLVTGNKVMVEYYLPFGKSVKRHYRLTEVQPRLFFRYTPIQPHVFTGEARVDFEVLGAETTRVKWSGSYRFRGLPLAYLYFKFYFEKQFFGSMQQGLAKLT